MENVSNGTIVAESYANYVFAKEKTDKYFKIYAEASKLETSKIDSDYLPLSFQGKITQIAYRAWLKRADIEHIAHQDFEDAAENANIDPDNFIIAANWLNVKGPVILNDIGNLIG